MYKILNKKGVSPVIGVILLVAVTVAIVSLATIIVFDLGNNVNETSDSSIQVSDNSDSINVNVIRNSNVDKFRVVYSNNEEAYTIDSSVGSLSTIPYNGGLYHVIAITNDGTEEVIYTGFNPIDSTNYIFTVTDDEDNTLEDVLVSTNEFTAQTDENGEIELEIEEGEYEFTLSDDGLSGTSNSFEINEDTTDVSIDIMKAENWRHSEHDDEFFPLNINTLYPNNDIIYTGSQDETVIAYNSTEQDKLWRHNLHADNIFTVYESNGVVYSGSNDNSVIAYDINEEDIIWSYEPTDNGWIESVQEQNDILYIGYNFDDIDDSGSYFGFVAGLDVTTGAELWNHQLHDTDFFVKSVYGDNGTVYSTGQDGNVIAYGLDVTISE